ncbi:MAG: WG repeat-containing protein [Butyrivibrio sp.]|uniref:WG repeat-containing protein n=1 Tax=Butyrivibrio sp. TaxID=28121 RepID=UPI0025FC47D1|nr:WG repeat-containing protein [Butyrivibrio sp.]MCR5771641.1 WG repeat-containing protein [Butyrivibrio sp.]
MKDYKKKQRENILITGFFVIIAVIMAVLLGRSGSPDNKEMNYICSFWRDFLYVSPKEYAMQGIISGFTGKSHKDLENGSYLMDDGNLFLFDNSQGKYGIANENGEWIVEPAYMEFDFQYSDKGIIITKADEYKNYGVMDLNYNLLIDPIYDNISVYEDLISVNEGDKYNCGVFDLNGNMVVEPIYNEVKIYNDCICARLDDDYRGTYILFDRKGNELARYNSDLILVYNKAITVRFVEDETCYFGVYDHSGNTILEPIYEDVDVFEDIERMIVKDSDNNYYLLDFECNDVLGGPCKYIDYPTHKDDDYAFIIEDQNSNYNICDKDGNILVDGNYDYLHNLYGSNEYFVAEIDGKEGLIDIDGNIYIDFKYDDLESVDGYEDILVASIDGKEGLIDIYGNIYIDFKYDYLESVNGYEDIFVAGIDGKKGMIDISGNILIDFNYKDIYEIEDAQGQKAGHYIVITENNYIGVAEGSEIVIEPQNYKLYTSGSYEYCEYLYISDYNILFFPYDYGKWVILKEGQDPVEVTCGQLKYLGADIFLGEFTGYKEYEMVYSSDGNYEYKYKDFLIDSSGQIIFEFDGRKYNADTATFEGKTLIAINDPDSAIIIYDGNTVLDSEYCGNFCRATSEGYVYYSIGDGRYNIYDYKGEYIGTGELP